MWQRWLKILLCIWLINSVTYFHSSNPLDHSQDALAGTADCASINTWVDYVSCLTDGDSSSSKSHKIKSPRRFLHSRNFDASIFLVVVAFALVCAAAFRKNVSRPVFNYPVNVALLPAYYNFLFRLSPF